MKASARSLIIKDDHLLMLCITHLALMSYANQRNESDYVSNYRYHTQKEGRFSPKHSFICSYVQSSYLKTANAQLSYDLRR